MQSPNCVRTTLDSIVYDNDDRVVHRREHMTGTKVHDDTLTYDANGRLWRARARWWRSGGQGAGGWARSSEAAGVLHSRRDHWCAGSLTSGRCQGAVQRTVWDGQQVLAEIRYPGNHYELPDSMERDTSTLKPINRDPCIINCPPPTDTSPSHAQFYGRVLYTHGVGIDAPLWLTRVGYYSQGASSVTITPLVNWRAQYDTGASSLPIQAWPGYWTEARLLDRERDVEMPHWMGSLVEQGRDGTGRFTQEDPIGLAGGLNLYGYANGDPVNFSDPFGLCPMCIAYAIFEVGSTAYDVYDLAKTTASFIGGRTSRTELAITAAGVGAGIVGFGGGYGKAGREAASRLIRDVSDNPNNCKAVGSFTEDALNKKAKGGVSIHTIMENEAGDRVVRHTVRDKAGTVIDDHYRPMYKARDVDRPKTP